MAFLDALALRLGRRLPLVLQTEATECGLACLAMIAGYHGHHTGLMELRRRFSVSLKGISLKQLIQTAHRLGLGTRAVKLDLGDLGKLKLPCVLHWNFNHFVVLKAVDGRGAVLHDPAHGQRRLGLEEVSRSFTGVALELWPESGFEKQEAPPRIKLLGMLGKVTGLYRSLAQVLLLAGALEVFSLISPFFLQWTIDNVIVSEDRDLLSTLAIGFGLLLLMQQAVSGVRAWVMMHMSTLLGVQWQANVFSHLLRLPAQYFEKRHLGDVVSRFGAVNSIQQTLTAAFLSAVLDGLMTVATLGMMLLYSPPLAAIAIAAMSLYALGRWIWYRPLRNATEEQIVHAARQQSHFLETVRGIRPLKLFQRQDERRSVWLGLLVEQINAGLRTQKLQLFYQQLNGLLFGVENLLVIWLGATMVMDGQFSVGILMAFNAYKSQFDSRVGSLIDKFFEPAHAPVAGRAPGRHRAPGPGGQPRRHPPGEPPRARGEHRDPGLALPLRGTGALGPRRPRPAHRRRRVGGHRRPLGLRQEHSVQRPAGHPPASGGTDPHGRPGPCATGPGRPARTGRYGAAGRRAVRRFAQRQHQFLRPAAGHALAAAVRADGCHPR